MVNVSFDSLVESKPIKLDIDGTPVCVTRIGDEVFCNRRYLFSFRGFAF
jgi:hypothetical protein